MAGNGGALDLPFILALVFLISAIVVVGNLVVDAFFVFFDPRGVLRSNTRGPTAKAAAGGVI